MVVASAQNQPIVLEYSAIWLILFRGVTREASAGNKIEACWMFAGRKDGILVEIGKRLTQTGWRSKSSLQGFGFWKILVESPPRENAAAEGASPSGDHYMPAMPFLQRANKHPAS